MRADNKNLRNVLIIFSVVILIILGIFFLKKQNINNVSNSNKSNITETAIKNTKQEDKKFLGNLDKNRGNIIKIDGIDMLVDPNFDGKSLKGFPKTKENLHKLINKLKELGLNNNNTNFIIKSVGDLPGPFLSVSATDKEKQKTLQTYKKETNNKIKIIEKENKDIANEIKERINTELSVMANNDNNGYCITNTMLGIKDGTSVQVCPDKSTFTKMLGKNKYIIQGTNKVMTIYNMPDYVNKDMTATDNGYEKIYNYNAYILYFPYVVNSSIKDIMITRLINYYNDMLQFNKMLFDTDGLLLYHAIRTANGLIVKNITDRNEVKKTIDNGYNKYKKDINKRKIKKESNKMLFIKKVKQYADVFKKYGNNISLLDYLPKIEKVTPDNIHSYILILDQLIQKSYFKDLLNNKKLLEEINKNLETKYITDRKGNKKELSKVGQDKVILWFYTDIINMLPNLAIDLYPKDERLIKLYIRNGLNDKKYTSLISIGFIQNQTNVNNDFQFFLYDIMNGGIIIEPKDTNIINFKKVGGMLKEGKTSKEINEVLIDYNKELFTPNKTCLKINKINQKYNLLSFKVSYKCSINNFVLDTFKKKISKFSKRASDFWTLLSGGKKKILPWLSDDKYFLLLKLYPDIMYWRFDTAKEREKFFKDFKRAIEILNKSSNKEIGMERFKREMVKYYKYFDDISDYRHLRGNINTLDLIFYGQK